MSNINDLNKIANPFKKWATLAVVIGTGIWATFFFVFLVLSALVPSIIPNSWFLKMVQQHPAGTLGVAICAISSFSVVTVLDIVSNEPISFKFFNFEFKGASGPVILWVICFLAFVTGTSILW